MLGGPGVPAGVHTLGALGEEGKLRNVNGPGTCDALPATRTTLLKLPTHAMAKNDHSEEARPFYACLLDLSFSV